MSYKYNPHRLLYAIRKPILKTGKPQHQLIGSNQQHFSLAIAKEPKEAHPASIEVDLVKQEQNKFGQYLYNFDIIQHLKISYENVLVGLPIQCVMEDGKYVLLQEQVRKFVFEFKSLLEHDQSEESEYSKFSESQPPINSIDHRCRGRPKGSKNRRKDSMEKSSEEEFVDQSNKKVQQKRGRGRPKGAKNIKKQPITSSQTYENELNIRNLFNNLFEIKSIEQITTKINRLKDKDDRVPLLKKEQSQGEEMIKRSRGRPKGVKNKPKLSNEDSESEQTQQLDNLPKRKYHKNVIIGKCCTKCHQKELIKSYIEGKEVDLDEINNVCEYLSPQNKNSVLLHILRSGNIIQIKAVLKKRNHRNNPFAISWESHCRLEESTYTVRTRKEFITKNKRQGIHALIQDTLQSTESIWWRAVGLESILEAIPHGPKSLEIYKLLIEQEPQLEAQINMNIASLVRCGNETLASHLFQLVLKEQKNTTIYGYHQLHWQTLQKKKTELHFKKTSMLKQSCTPNFCSPIHCATINSNTELLQYILKLLPDLSTGDSLGRKPIHYAAVLESSKALEMLVKNGADLKEIDKKKMTPLMLASKYGRTKNVKFILEKVRDPHYINFKSDCGLAAIHYAVLEKHTDCFNIFLEDILSEKEVQTKEGMNIFHLAASTGQKDIMKVLLDKEYTPQPDNFRRTPLMLAIRNHQNQSFFYLFQSVHRYYKRDHSYNTMLHYAAAYGNLEIVKYLQDIGVVQTMNRKKFYPFEIAVLKGHYQCAKMLENWSLHFSHHLPNRLTKNPRGTEQFYQMFEYLLETQKYDLNYKNPVAYGYTCLHFVCSVSESDYNRLRTKENFEVNPHQYEQMQERLISMLLKYGADSDIQNERGEKPLKLCIQNQNLIGIQLLLRDIPFDLSPVRSSYIYYLTKIGCQGEYQLQFVYSKLLQTDEKILRNEVRKVDMNGFQFLIYFVKKFTECAHNNFRANYHKYRQMHESDQAILMAFEDYIRHEDVLIKTINHLVEMGADPKFTVSEPRMDEEYQNYKKWGIQHFLMRFPSPNLLKIFMKWIDTNFNLQNSQGRTPLHLFCMWNHQGSIFNQNQDGLPVIHLPEMKHFEGIRCMEYLLENGLTCNVLDINRSTPLLYAASRNQIAFIKLLRNFGSTINNVNAFNQVPLIELIHQRNKLTLEQFDNLLSDEHLRSDFKDINDRNALHHLVSVAKNFDNSPEICKKLFEYGVNINSLDKYGRSPLFYCFIKIQQNESSNDDSNDKVEILQTLLAHQDIDLTIIDIYHRTPLHYACQKGFFFSILYLLQKWTEIDIVDSEGNTPLAICLKNKNLNQAAMLIRKGVQHGWVMEDGQKYSYVQYALKTLPVGICFMLIDHGYPLGKAIEEAQDFRPVLLKKYGM